MTETELHSTSKIASSKRPFDLDEVIRRLRRAIEAFPKAMLFELADRGFTTPFEQTIACLISIRTLDEVSLDATLRLFARSRSPARLASLSTDEIDRLIQPATFHTQKAHQIRKIAELTVDRYEGKLPCDQSALLALPGIGPKCANLVLGIACNQQDKIGVGVDIHVHRITNRWGYVKASTPEKTLARLTEILPPKYRVEMNALLVPFGKHICTRLRPKCSTCPILEFCRQVGVVNPR